MITHLLEVYGVSFPKGVTTLKQGAEIGQLTIWKMLQEGTRSKKRKIAPLEAGSSRAAVPPPLVHIEGPPVPMHPPLAADPAAPPPPPAP